MTPSKKDQLKQRLASQVQSKIQELHMTVISGTSAPPGCGIVEVNRASINVSRLSSNVTNIDVKTPDGVRMFEVMFKEVY